MSPTDLTTQASDAGRELVLAVVATHSSGLLSLARRYSYCADDAHDAYQRALEIFLRRADSLEPATAPAWLRTVVKHEAMAVRAARQRIVGPTEVDLDRTEARDLLPADELAAASERDGHSAEALARLKPQEIRALVLKARGYSYREICEITGWTYTKVNRCLTEGRRAFLDRFADIEAGRECERWAGTLSALADGEASPAELAAIRPHLRHCQACRARLREFRTTPRAVAALAPVPLVAGADHAAAALPEAQHGPDAAFPGDQDALSGAVGLVSRVHDAVMGGWHERIVLSAHKVQAGVEAASAGKLAAVAASATALAGGGAAALTDVADRPPVRPAAAVSAPAGDREPSSDAAATPTRDAIAPSGPSPGEADATSPGPEAPPEPRKDEPPPAAEFDLGREPAPAEPGYEAPRSAAPAASPSPAPPRAPSRSSASPAASPASEFGP